MLHKNQILLIELRFKAIADLFGNGNDKKLDIIIEMLGSNIENINNRLDTISILYKAEKEIEDTDKNG